jgi:hypothetical protein
MMMKGMKRSAVSFADPLPHAATPTTLRKSLRARVAKSGAEVLLMWRRLVELAATERKPAVLPSQSVSLARNCSSSSRSSVSGRTSWPKRWKV